MITRRDGRLALALVLGGCAGRLHCRNQRHWRAARDIDQRGGQLVGGGVGLEERPAAGKWAVE